MSGNTLIRFNLKWNYGKTSFRGRTFADVKAVPALAQWILALPEPTGQMESLAVYLMQANEAIEKRAGADKAHVVYRLTPDESTERALVDVDEMAALIDAHGKDHAMAGGLRCECNHRMKFVPSYKRNDGSAVSAHFSHVVTSANASGSSTNGGGTNGGGCSDVHLLAAKLLVKNVKTIQLKRFRQCGECVEFAFGPNPRTVAKEEVSARNDDGGRIRSDVAVYEDGKKIMTLEVRKTHKTDPASRVGVPYLEINAGHVIAMLGGANGSTTTRLNCENADEPCTCNCAERRAEAAERRAEEAAARWSKRRLPNECPHCGGNGYVKGEPCWFCNE